VNLLHYRYGYWIHEEDIRCNKYQSETD